MAYAAEELSSYLAELTGREVERREHEAYDADADGLWVGTADAIDDADPPDVEAPALDDALHVEADGARGFVAGNVPRATLLAAYRYLREQGCRWLRPGEDGERVPDRDDLDAVSVRETPDYRHRGITIEGAVSEAHVRDVVEWAPRVGFNAYFVQFFDGYPFYRRWYRHENNPEREPEAFSPERAREIHERVVAEIDRRDMVYHAVGHGWTSEALGLPGRGWEPEDPAGIDADTRELLAEIDGERGLYEGVPVNTELCYSNTDARRRMVETIADHAEDHDEVDVLHVWASDGHNNHCECADCRGTRPADFYVRILNALDVELTDRGLDTRVAFLAYTDLLWPPETERFENPDRFALMFAPIMRRYTETYADVGALPELAPYERNELEFPESIEGNVASLDAWREVYDGDAFDFDYHLMYDQYSDPGGTTVAETIGTDVRHLADLGLNGNVSCQVQRSFFPTGLAMAVMAETLWDRDRSLDDVAGDYFPAAFGEDAPAVREYLEDVSDLFAPLYADDVDYFRGGTPARGEDVAASYDGVAGRVDEFRPVLDRNPDHDDPAVATSWAYLDFHAEVCVELAEALAIRARGDDEAARERYEALQSLVGAREDEFATGFDVFSWVQMFDDVFYWDDD